MPVNLQLILVPMTMVDIDFGPEHFDAIQNVEKFYSQAERRASVCGARRFLIKSSALDMKSLKLADDDEAKNQNKFFVTLPSCLAQ